MFEPRINREGQRVWFHTRNGKKCEVSSKSDGLWSVSEALGSSMIQPDDILPLFTQIMYLKDLPDQEPRRRAPSHEEGDEDQPLVLLEEVEIVDDEQLEKHLAEVHHLVTSIMKLYESGQANTPTM